MRIARFMVIAAVACCAAAPSAASALTIQPQVNNIVLPGITLAGGDQKVCPMVDIPFVFVGMLTLSTRTLTTGFAFDGTVATGRDIVLSGPLRGPPLKAVIFWGDGLAGTSEGQITEGASGQLTVSGHHFYEVPGTFRAEVLVQRQTSPVESCAQFFDINVLPTGG